jgi:hypothetical protein
MPPSLSTGFLFHLVVHQLSVSIETEPKYGQQKSSMLKYEK